MSRIFVSLSVLPIVLLVATMFAGFWIGDYNSAYHELREKRASAETSMVTSQATDLSAAESAEQTMLLDLESISKHQQRFKIHFQLGLASALATLLINCLSVTYLIGTSRWVKEVTDAYELNPRFDQQAKQLKRHTFPWSLAGIITILIIVSLGAASDPGTLRSTTADYVVPHLTASMVGLGAILWAILVQAINLHRNSLIIDQVVIEVRKERLLRGLDVEVNV